MATIQAAKARLEARQREIDRAAGRAPGDNVAPRAGKRGHAFKHPFGEPLPKAQENFTHADSQIMRTADGYQQGYNAQAAVGESLLIVAATVSNIASDAPQLLPVLEQVRGTLGWAPRCCWPMPAMQARRTSRGWKPRIRWLASRWAAKESYCPNDRSGPPSIHRTHAHMACDEGKAHYRHRKTLP